MLSETNTDLAKFLTFFKIEKLDDMRASDYDRAVRALSKKAAKEAAES